MMADVELWSLETDGYLLYTLQRIDVLMGFDLDELELVEMPDGSTAEVTPSYAKEFGYDFTVDNWQPLLASTYEEVVSAGRTVLCRMTSLSVLVSGEVPDEDGRYGMGGEIVYDALTVTKTEDFQSFIEAYGWGHDVLGEFELVTVDRYFLLGPDEIESTLGAMVVKANQYTDGGATTSDGDTPIDTLLYYPVVKTKEFTVNYQHEQTSFGYSHWPDFEVTYEYEYHAAKGLYVGYYYTTGLGEYRAGQVPDRDAITGTYTRTATEQNFKDLLDASSAASLESLFKFASATPGLLDAGSNQDQGLANPITYIDRTPGFRPQLGYVGTDGADAWDASRIYFVSNNYVYDAMLSSPYTIYGRYESGTYSVTPGATGENVIVDLRDSGDTALVLYWPAELNANTNYTSPSVSTITTLTTAYDQLAWAADYDNDAYSIAESGWGLSADSLLVSYASLLETKQPGGTFPYARGHDIAYDMESPFAVDTAVDYAVTPGEDPEVLEQTIYQGHRLYTAAEYAAEFEADEMTAYADVGSVLLSGLGGASERVMGASPGSTWPPDMDL